MGVDSGGYVYEQPSLIHPPPLTSHLQYYSQLCMYAYLIRVFLKYRTYVTLGLLVSVTKGYNVTKRQ